MPCIYRPVVQSGPHFQSAPPVHFGLVSSLGPPISGQGLYAWPCSLFPLPVSSLPPQCPVWAGVQSGPYPCMQLVWAIRENSHVSLSQPNSKHTRLEPLEPLGSLLKVGIDPAVNLSHRDDFGGCSFIAVPGALWPMPMTCNMTHTPQVLTQGAYNNIVAIES